MSALPGYDFWKTHDAEREAEEARQEAIDERFEALAADPDMVAKAREWMGGRLDGSQYTDLERLLDELHDYAPDRLVGSDTLANLYRLAGIYRELRDEWLREQAEDDVARGEV